MLHFVKYQALGNDYLVVENISPQTRLAAEKIRRICHRNYGLGADGILIGDCSSPDGFSLTIWNPDGTEAEKSGNGLRIFARYLWDQQYVVEEPFKVRTKGGMVTCLVATRHSCHPSMSAMRTKRSSALPCSRRITQP